MTATIKGVENFAPKECVMGKAFAFAQNSIHVLLTDVMERNVDVIKKVYDEIQGFCNKRGKKVIDISNKYLTTTHYLLIIMLATRKDTPQTSTERNLSTTNSYPNPHNTIKPDHRFILIMLLLFIATHHGKIVTIISQMKISNNISNYIIEYVYNNLLP